MLPREVRAPHHRIEDFPVRIRQQMSEPLSGITAAGPLPIRRRVPALPTDDEQLDPYVVVLFGATESRPAQAPAWPDAPVAVRPDPRHPGRGNLSGGNGHRPVPRAGARDVTEFRSRPKDVQNWDTFAPRLRLYRRHWTRPWPRRCAEAEADSAPTCAGCRLPERAAQGRPRGGDDARPGRSGRPLQW